MQAQDASQIAEVLQSVTNLPQVQQNPPDAAFRLLQPLLDASAARLLQLQQQPKAEPAPEQSSGVAKRAWGFLSGIWRGPAQPAAELAPEALPDSAEGLQVQLAACLPAVDDVHACAVSCCCCCCCKA